MSHCDQNPISNTYHKDNRLARPFLHQNVLKSKVIETNIVQHVMITRENTNELSQCNSGQVHCSKSMPNYLQRTFENKQNRHFNF